MSLQSMFSLNRLAEQLDSSAILLASFPVSPSLFQLDPSTRFELGRSDNSTNSVPVQVENCPAPATTIPPTASLTADCLKPAASLPDSYQANYQASCRENIGDYILLSAAPPVTSGVLHQDFIWWDEPPSLTEVALLESPPSGGWNLAGVALLGLAILPGLWLSYLGISAGQPHQKLLMLAIELFLIGLQLFCFGLSLALLMETHHRFPEITQSKATQSNAN